ncbi:hypothetical protein LWI28_026352 [Acer negundo]|uniref:Uncharacterized protein n=1 Tax=Acer negundo TaxID=4023 RepID=A0AAD5JEQ4_ACENE|nr:hypothetical protein LWI28_026352 [Acer negundo]
MSYNTRVLEGPVRNGNTQNPVASRDLIRQSRHDGSESQIHNRKPDEDLTIFYIFCLLSFILLQRIVGV